MYRIGADATSRSGDTTGARLNGAGDARCAILTRFDRPSDPHREGQPIRFSRSLAGLLALSLLLGTVPAAAAPIADKRTYAAGIKRQLDRLDVRMEVAVEDYNTASHQYRQVSLRLAENRALMRRLDARIGLLQKSLATRADSMYRAGPTGLMTVLLGAASFEDLATTWDLLNAWNDREAAAVSELRTKRVTTRRVASEVRALRSEAKAQLDIVTGRRRSIEGDVATRRRLLRGVEAEIAALEAAERERAARDVATRSGSGGLGWDWGSPTREPRGGVVEVAMRYLGRPYHWAAAGPDSFDCSGFTMFVYGKVGVSLPHSSRGQISSGQRVSRSTLKPGDLVFFGSPIHHVGIYVGGGRMVHSPHTGDVVSVDSIDRGDYSGACRP